LALKWTLIRFAADADGVGWNDLIVAATAIYRHWAVATFNGAEFKRIEGITVIEP
jgi:predicted nucleic acid-binding protein